MAMDFGNLLGAATSLTTAFSDEKSVKQFLSWMNKFGIQVENNFEVNIFGLQDVTFFIQSVSFGGINQSFTELFYDGRSVKFPTYVDYDHEGSLEVINDANGYIYAAIKSFVIGNNGRKLDSGMKMTIKCINGDPDYKGSVITLNSVRFNKIDGLKFGYSQNEISKFQVSFTYLDFNFTPGILAKAAGIIGTANSILG